MPVAQSCVMIVLNQACINEMRMFARSMLNFKEDVMTEEQVQALSDTELQQLMDALIAEEVQDQPEEIQRWLDRHDIVLVERDRRAVRNVA
jgi:hypothetical protein